jgi:hypothetical protein
VSNAFKLRKLYENRENDLYIRNIEALKISNNSATKKDSSGFCVIEFNSALQGIRFEAEISAFL